MKLLLLAELRRRWAEYLLGGVVVALIVAALVSQRAITASADASVHDLAHRLGKNMLVLPAAADVTAFYGQQYGKESLPAGAPAAIQASPLAPHIRAMQPRLYGNVTVRGVPLVLVGEDRHWPSLPGVEPAVVGGDAARALSVGQRDHLEVGGTTLALLGVDGSAADGLGNAIFVPLATAQRILGRPGEINALRLGGCWCTIDVATLAGQIERLVPGSRAITVAGMIRAQKGTLATMSRYSSALLVGGFVLAGAAIALLVSAQVRRRLREIGLLIAVGAPPRRLAALFTVKAGVAGALGGLGGWLLAIPATRALSSRILGAGAEPPSELLVPAVLLGALVSIAAALLPARRAAALDPTHVLRET